MIDRKEYPDELIPANKTLRTIYGKRAITGKRWFRVSEESKRYLIKVWYSIKRGDKLKQSYFLKTYKISRITILKWHLKFKRQEQNGKQ